jgi:hypothetical protein
MGSSPMPSSILGVWSNWYRHIAEVDVFYGFESHHPYQIRKENNMKWITDEIVRRLDTIPGNKVINVGYQGGDYDTREIAIGIPPLDFEKVIFIRGFHTTNEISNPDNCEIEMVEVQDGMDSSGGLRSNNPELIKLYAEVRLRLTDFIVVDKMDDYF